MNHLLSVRTNIMYSKKAKEDTESKEEYKKFSELIFLVDKPTYKRTNDGEVIRERAVDEFRFMVSDQAFDKMIEILQDIRNAKEEDIEQ